MAKFKQEHRKMRKNWDLPERFPDARVIKAYREVTASLTAGLACCFVCCLWYQPVHAAVCHSTDRGVGSASY